MSITVNSRPDTVSLTGNPIVYSMSSAAAASDPTLYWQIKVWFKYIGGSPAALAEFTYYPAAGAGKIDISEILDSKLQYYVPPVSSSYFGSAPYQSGIFYLEYREIDPDSSVPSYTSDSGNERVIIKGGLNYYIHRGDNFFDEFHKPTGQDYNFLTWQQKGRLAAVDENLYLYHLNMNGFAPGVNFYALKATVYYTDGTSQTITKDAELPGVIYKIYYLAAGATQLGLDALNPTKTIYYWEVWLDEVDASAVFVDQITQKFQFYTDYRNTYNNTCIYYRNSLGGLDSVRVRGFIEKSTDYITETAELAVPPDYYSSDVIAPRKKVVSNAEKIKFKADIGLVGKEEQDRYRDIFLIREAYIQRYAKWLPIIIENTGFKLNRSDDNTWSVPIEWSYADGGDPFYTPFSIDLDP